MIQHPDTLLCVADARIAWVLDHPQMSEWLKQAVRTSDGLDPVALLNDVEVLSQLIRFRANIQVEILTRGPEAENPAVRSYWPVERDPGK